MRILIFGANGFVGKAIASSLDTSHKVWRASRSMQTGERAMEVDLLDRMAVTDALHKAAPEVVINAAGIVDNTDASLQNVIFTQNILEALALIKQTPMPRLIVCGSAAEYGYVRVENMPVGEDCPTEPFSTYGKAKYEETQLALKFGADNGIDVVIARIFNPIGIGMADKFMIPRLLSQIGEFKLDRKNTLEISRKDSTRDYIDIHDLAAAIKLLCENKTKHKIYNIGSGIGTTNKELVRTLLRNIGKGYDVTITETSSEPERQVASRADTARMIDEFGWKAVYSLDDTIKEILSGKE